jgi:transposase
MYLCYDDLIAESADDLLRLERQHRRSPVAARLKMLRLLKSGAYRSRRALASVLGYSERQLHRWFETYREEGLEAVVHYETSRGSRERITPDAWNALEAEMKAGRIGRLKDAQQYLADEHGIAYSLDGLSGLFQRRKTKLKTGRPRHVKASADEQEAWKKTVR